jgi:hypothetical protein
MTLRPVAVLMPMGLLALLPSPANAEQPTAWQQQKCALYEDAWGRALASIGSDNVNYNFVANNENFIASECTERVNVCPRSNQELEIANLLTMVMMNEGAASTFLPFTCAEE